MSCMVIPNFSRNMNLTGLGSVLFQMFYLKVRFEYWNIKYEKLDTFQPLFNIHFRAFSNLLSCGSQRVNPSNLSHKTWKLSLLSWTWKKMFCWVFEKSCNTTVDSFYIFQDILLSQRRKAWDGQDYEDEEMIIK